ncbi:MAG: hypothetical protein ACW99A_22550 [Candidatus Kariarchaeaceae archaeon]|jgi:hypothetical protein
MQKFALLLLPLIFIACDKTFDEIVDSSPNNYQATTIEGIKDTVDLRNPGDSLLTVRVILEPGSEINSASFDLLDPDNSPVNSSSIPLLLVSENIYENQFIMEEDFINGKYTINIFIVGTNGINNLAAVSIFRFNNGVNFPPEIANTVIEPDTVLVNKPTVIFTSVEASDPNGLNDIDLVFFVVYRPDSTTSGARIELFDNGNIDNGDQVAGDGIYSLLIQVNETNAKGTYRFEFQAIDRGGIFSNKIDHFVLIQ